MSECNGSWTDSGPQHRQSLHEFWNMSCRVGCYQFEANADLFTNIDKFTTNAYMHVHACWNQTIFILFQCAEHLSITEQVDPQTLRGIILI